MISPSSMSAGAFAITSVAIAAMAHDLTLPFRRFGRALIVAQTVGFPTVTWVTVALEDLGVEVEIRVYGRSAWEGELPGTAGRCPRQPISATPTTRRVAS